MHYCLLLLDCCFVDQPKLVATVIRLSVLMSSVTFSFFIPHLFGTAASLPICSLVKML